MRLVLQHLRWLLILSCGALHGLRGLRDLRGLRGLRHLPVCYHIHMGQVRHLDRHVRLLNRRICLLNRRICLLNRSICHIRLPNHPEA
jgi:hypothetical protein